MTDRAGTADDRPGAGYEVHLHPPAYPDRSFPGRCRHAPQFVMVASTSLVREAGRSRIELDHVVCFNCGRSLPSTYGGNVLVDLSMIETRIGPSHWAIAQRAAHLRGKWARIASYLFDESGWTGRHRAIARLIDPTLTMRLEFTALRRPGHRVAEIFVDPAYLRPAPADAQLEDVGAPA